jgi:hypothetical protein
MTFLGGSRNHFRTSMPRFVNASIVYAYGPVLAGNMGQQLTSQIAATLPSLLESHSLYRMAHQNSLANQHAAGLGLLSQLTSPNFCVAV